MNVSPTGLDSFSCRLAWHWGYKYEPVRPNVTFELGIGVHVALEAFYAKQRSPAKVFGRWVDGRIAELDPQFDDDLAAMLNARALGIAMLEGYVERWATEPFKVITTEHTCKRPLRDHDGNKTGAYINARLDAIVEDTSKGKLFVLEHKTFSQFTLGQLFRDHQFVCEAWLAKRLAKELVGRPIAGVIYNGLRKQVPGPRVKLELFERHHIYVNKAQIAIFQARAYDTWLLMNDPNVLIYPQPNLIRCNMCAFKETCVEYMRGGDYQYLLDNLFRVREGYENR